MKILLAGQKRFGRDTLEMLRATGHTVVTVACPVDPRDKLWISTQNLSLPVIPAGTLTASTMPPGIDLIVCAHSHDFIGRRTRLTARWGAIGYHPSLLPLHRGRDAIRWAVTMRDRVTGGSVYWLNDTVDGGPIAAQDWCFIRPNDSAKELWARELAPMGLALLRRVVTDVDRGVIVRIPQDHTLATWEPSMDGAPRLYRPDLLMIGPSETPYITERTYGGNTPV